MKFFLVIVLCICSAILYGIVHDQITARICVEYFTIGHPPVFNTTSPTLLGLGWGVIATWWVGLILGVPLAIAARLGNRPKINPSSLLRPIAVLLIVMACSAVIAGIIGYVLARNGRISLLEPLASSIPPDKHVAFLADAWSHGASYLVGFFGGVVLVIMTWKSRSSSTTRGKSNASEANERRP